MSQDYKPRVNLKLTQLTHRLLKVWCAERNLTLQAGATRLIEEGIKKKVGPAAAAGMVETAPGTWVYPKSAPTAAQRAAPTPTPDPTPDPDPEPEEQYEEEPYDPNYYYQHWRKVGYTHEAAMEMIREACEEAGIPDWQPPEEPSVPPGTSK